MLSDFNRKYLENKPSSRMTLRVVAICNGGLPEARPFNQMISVETEWDVIDKCPSMHDVRNDRGQ